MSDTLSTSRGSQPRAVSMDAMRTYSQATGRHDSAQRKLMNVRADAILDGDGTPLEVAGRVVALSAAVFAREPDGGDRPASEDEWLVPDQPQQRTGDPWDE